jgi:hypothetical protein
VSYSWVDPHFAVLYARREEERLAERLATRLRSLGACEPAPGTVVWRGPAWSEDDRVLPWAGHLKLV